VRQADKADFRVPPLAGGTKDGRCGRHTHPARRPVKREHAAPLEQGPTAPFPGVEVASRRSRYARLRKCDGRKPDLRAARMSFAGCPRPVLDATLIVGRSFVSSG
jgi:hypothetical protein